MICKKISRFFYKAPTALLVGFGFLLVASGLFINQDRRKILSAPPKIPDGAEIITENQIAPAENKPNIEQYIVLAHEPRRIILPSIVVEGLVQKIGLTVENAISAPSNVHFAGWYTGSVLPGEKGLSIIDGHVSGRYTDGVFKNLEKVKIGDKFQVEFGSLSKKIFEVIETKKIGEVESAEFLFIKRDGIYSQLNLITCGGKFNSETNSYSDRIIVVSKLL